MVLVFGLHLISENKGVGLSSLKNEDRKIVPARLPNESGYQACRF
jgi:hypothetical protein